MQEYVVVFKMEAASRRLNPPLITMSGVSFAYKAAAPALFSDLDFELSMDSRIALVGCVPVPQSNHHVSLKSHLLVRRCC